MLKNELPAISVLMPVYNSSQYLAEAIESVLAQTFEDFEFVIIDDYSMDNSVQIINNYISRDSRINLVKNELGKGLVNALIFGITQCRAPLIARMDADDICLPERLRLQFLFLKTHLDIHALGTDYFRFNEEVGYGIDSHPSDPLELAWKMGWKTQLGHPTVMFRKSTIEAVGGYPDMAAEDYALFSKIAIQYKVANLNEVLLKYRWHGKNKSLLELDLSQKDVMDISSRYLENFGIPKKFHGKYFAYHYRKVVALEDLFYFYYVNFKIIFILCQKQKAGLLPLFKCCAQALAIPCWNLLKLIKSKILAS
jgi:glycosyltransferase involved in cell wall biosynthesis